MKILNYQQSNLSNNELEDLHEKDMSNFIDKKSNFTIISMHDASPDYISNYDNDSVSFISFLEKSSKCQDAIINKFYNSFDQDLTIVDTQNFLDNSSELLNRFENNITFGDRKKFSFFTSLLDKSNKYFSGEDDSFGYALNRLNIDTNQIKNFVISNINQNNFFNFYKNCLGFNNRNDIISSQINELDNIDENEIFSVTENTAILSLIQLLNISLHEGNNKSLTHGTNFYNINTSNDNDNYLTFNKRDINKVNIVLGNDFNKTIHLNYFNTTNNVENFDNANFNILKRERFIDKVYSNKILSTERNFTSNLLSGDKTQNRISDFISYDTVNQNIPDNYKIFLNSLLKTNTSISSLGVLKNGNINTQYRNQKNRTFLENSNIEVNNILFGFDNDLKYGNLSYYTQALKKKISSSRKSFFNLMKVKLYTGNSLIKHIDNKSNLLNEIKSRLGVTHRNTRSSIVSRDIINTFTNLFVYDNVDIFETNNYLTNKNGFNYFTRSNINEIENIINIHSEEVNKVEALTDSYYDNQISNVDIYKDLLRHASEGVSNSLLRFNESIQFDYGNLPIHLLEETAFISRFTGNKNYKLESLISDQKAFKDFLIDLLYYSINDKEEIEEVKSLIPDDIPAKLNILDQPNITLESFAEEIYNARFDTIYNGYIPARGTKLNKIDLINSINSNEGLTLTNSKSENDFRRYSQDINSQERRSNNILSPRYFLLCGMPVPDIYSGNIEDLDEQRFSNLAVYYNENKDRLSRGCELVYKPFIGFILKSPFGNFSNVNTFHKIEKTNSILSQLLQQKTGIFSSYIDFLKSYLTKAEVSERNIEDLSLSKKKYTRKFIEETFTSYCYLVTSKLSQTFEYSTTLSATKLFSEAPLDFYGGLLPSPDLSIGDNSGLIRERNILIPTRALAGAGFNYFYGEYLSQEQNFNKWLYPDGNYDSYKSNVLFINFFDKSSNQNRRNGWDGRNNHRSSIPSTIENLIKTLYFQNEAAYNTFLNYYFDIEFTDENAALSDANNPENFPRANQTKFTGGNFYKEIFTNNSIEGNNGNINDQENNNNEYTRDLIEESRQFLYKKNKFLNNNNQFIEAGANDIENIYIFYWSQYNSNYPIIHKNNYIFNMYTGFVRKAYTDMQNRIESSLFFDSTLEENKDAIFHILNKVHSGIFSEDLTIGYLFDTYRYAFRHLSFYKDFLESLEEANEEVDEESVSSEEAISLFTEELSRHYDQPDLFTFDDYITKINESQNTQIRFNALEKENSLQQLVENIRNSKPLNSQRHFNDAKTFKQEFIRYYPDTKILCVGMKDNVINTKNKVLKIIINKYDSIKKIYSNDFVVKFKFNYFVPESNGSEGGFRDYEVLEYNEIERVFKNIDFDNLENDQVSIVNNHIFSYLSKKYLQVMSGFGVDENSLRLSLDNVKATKSESPRVITDRASLINEKLQELNDEYIEMSNVSQETLENDGEFSFIKDNIDYNVENDVYTDIIDTNIKNKQDIYKRLLQFDYNNFSNESLGEIYMPKEFTKVLYIPLHWSFFRFSERLDRQSNIYSLKVNISFE